MTRGLTILMKYYPETDLPKHERPACGARTRAGHLCKAKVVKGKNRCRMHGGSSTGARTPEGIERIRQAQNRRWAKHHTRNVVAC